MSINQALSSTLNRDLFWGPWTEFLYEVKPQAKTLSPAVDIVENEDNFALDFDLPGLKKEDIDIEVKGNSLVVTGKREFSSESKQDSYRHFERQYGEFRREFTLPENVKTDAIVGKYENGVLHVEIPKTELAKPRKIPLVTSA